MGDALLKQVGERLRKSIRASDSVARLGGDEFAIVQGNVDQPLGATTLAVPIIEEISAPYHIDDHQLVIGTSVGRRYFALSNGRDGARSAPQERGSGIVPGQERWPGQLSLL
jgi:diguanylate cyclase (GGDEF)-like protein